MSNSLPWSNIRKPDEGYQRRLASTQSIVPVFWGKNPQSQNLLIIELNGDYSGHFKQTNLSVRGMTVDLRLVGRTQVIVITLEEQVNSDLFYSFCRSLIIALEAATDPSTAPGIASKHIERWRLFLSGRSKHRLSDEEVRGLFGELWVLRQLFNYMGDAAEAISAWCGPDNVHQDFIFRDTAIETKTLSGRERSSVRISSEDQLETLSDRLYLSVLRLVTTSERSSHAFSLNELVHIIENELADAVTLDEFCRKISSIGYFELPDYDEPFFIVANQQFYHVKEDFPRLARSELPDGITKVSYDIRLETIENYKCSEKEVWF